MRNPRIPEANRPSRIRPHLPQRPLPRHAQPMSPEAIIQRVTRDPNTVTQDDLDDLNRTLGYRGTLQLLEDMRQLHGRDEPLSPEGAEHTLRQSMCDFQDRRVGHLLATLKAEHQAEANRTGMPDGLKSGLEQLSGMNLSDVRVHRNSSKPSKLQALAYTQGQDIHLGPGQERHLGHEGWHVVQQLQGRVKPTIEARGVSINNDGHLEREADVMGEL